jgi:hypothetical protein
MKRGFKADSERRAAAAREMMGLGSNAKLCPWAYASALDILVLAAGDLDLPAKHLEQLLKIDPGSWSGMTLDEDDVKLIVLNSSHSQARQTSTLMHEIAHIELDHVPASVNVSPSGLTLLSDYSEEQEEEADWLGAALLLPQSALLQYRGQGLSMAQIASTFGVSNDLVAWRCRMTGVEKRMAFRRRA